MKEIQNCDISHFDVDPGDTNIPISGSSLAKLEVCHFAFGESAGEYAYLCTDPKRQVLICDNIHCVRRIVEEKLALKSTKNSV